MIRATTISPTKRTTLNRLPKLATYERDNIYQILDEGFGCYVGFIVDGHLWACELPLRLVAGAPISDPRLKQHIQAPAYIRNYQVQSRVITKLS